MDSILGCPASGAAPRGGGAAVANAGEIGSTIGEEYPSIFHRIAMRWIARQPIGGTLSAAVATVRAIPTASSNLQLRFGNATEPASGRRRSLRVALSELRFPGTLRQGPISRKLLQRVRGGDGDFPYLCPCADAAQFSRGGDPFVDREHPAVLLSDSGRDFRCLVQDRAGAT